MEIHISNWTHKFQIKTGLDANANSELYKSNQVCMQCGLFGGGGIPSGYTAENVLGGTDARTCIPVAI